MKTDALDTLYPVQTPRGRTLSLRTERRSQRRLNRRIAQVVAWWAAMQCPRPEFMAPLTLQRSLNQPLRRMAVALRWLGWRKIIRRVHGKQVALWLPPSTALQPRPQGRPRIYASL